MSGKTGLRHSWRSVFWPDSSEWQFDPVNVARARKAQHLVQDYGLNMVGLALVLELMDERDALKHKLSLLMGS